MEFYRRGIFFVPRVMGLKRLPYFLLRFVDLTDYEMRFCGSWAYLGRFSFTLLEDIGNGEIKTQKEIS